MLLHFSTREGPGAGNWSRSTCADVGKLGTAPITVVATAPAAQPRRAASSKPPPAARQAASAPQKASPAAVVSTTCTGYVGTASQGLSRLGHEGALLAQGDHDGGAALVQEPLSGLGRYQATRQGQSFGLVGHQYIDQCDKAPRERPGHRRGVEDGDGTKGAAQAQHRLYSWERHLQLSQHHRGWGHQAPGGFDVLGPEVPVCPGRHHDRVTATFLDRYQRGTAG